MSAEREQDSNKRCEEFEKLLDEIAAKEVAEEEPETANGWYGQQGLHDVAIYYPCDARQEPMLAESKGRVTPGYLQEKQERATVRGREGQQRQERQPIVHAKGEVTEEWVARVNEPGSQLKQAPAMSDVPLRRHPRQPIRQCYSKRRVHASE